MYPDKLLSVTLLLVVCFVCCSSRQLTIREVNYFRNHVQEWGAPAISQVTGGTFKVEGGKKSMSIQYISQDKVCTAEYSKMNTGMKGHSWTCTGKARPIKKYMGDEDGSFLDD